MLLDQLDAFDIFRPKMDFIKDRLHAIATVGPDISPVFPYLNAELGGWDYDPGNHVLMLKLTDGKWITLHPHEIAMRGLKDIAEAHALAAWIQGQINEVYERRESITPRYLSQARLKVMAILKNLPLTNCRACSYATCMAYAVALREGEISPRDCPPLGEEKFAEKRQKLMAYLESYGWRALDE